MESPWKQMRWFLHALLGILTAGGFLTVDGAEAPLTGCGTGWVSEFLCRAGVFAGGFEWDSAPDGLRTHPVGGKRWEELRVFSFEENRQPDQQW